MTLQQLKKRGLAALFPNRCAYCGEVIPYPDRVCEECAATLPLIEQPACRYCGRAAEECRCDQRAHPYDRCIAPLYYEKRVQSGILRMKAQERPYIVEEFALRMIRAFLQSEEAVPDEIVYVPMTRKEERRRGFNQSRLLAKQVGIGLERPVVSALQKIQETKPQKSLAAWERSGNVLGVFDLVSGVTVAGKRLLLIDDLVTTGATAGECAKVLKLYGATQVILLTAALTPEE